MAHSKGLESIPETRRAPHMEKYVILTPTVVEDEPDAHTVHLKVGDQQFVVGRFACETKGDAEWMRDMLCVALDKIARAECSDKNG